ncbi:MAG: DUF4410 domain-containing protein [Rhodospirillales bacterium]
MRHAGVAVTLSIANEASADAGDGFERSWQREAFPPPVRRGEKAGPKGWRAWWPFDKFTVQQTVQPGREDPMTAVRRAACWLVLAVLAGCASSDVTSYEPTRGTIAKPDRIIVYDIAPTASELAPEVAIAGKGAVASPVLDAEQRALARRLGAEIAINLVEELRSMGLPAVRAEGAPAPRPGDGLVVGYFATVDAGSAVERVALGFGAGGAEIKTVVKGYQQTEQGLRALGSGEVEAGSGRMPGGVVPLVVAVATANPVGLVVGGAVKAHGEVSGSETIEGAAKRTAHEIAVKIEASARKQGWI